MRVSLQCSCGTFYCITYSVCTLLGWHVVYSTTHVCCSVWHHSSGVQYSAVIIHSSMCSAVPLCCLALLVPTLSSLETSPREEVGQGLYSTQTTLPVALLIGS